MAIGQVQVSAQVQPAGGAPALAMAEFRPAWDPGPPVAELLTAALPDMLARLRRMRGVMTWLEDGEAAAEMLWAAPEQGAATLAHVAGQARRLDSTLWLLAQLADRAPSPPCRDPAANLRRAMRLHAAQPRHPLAIDAALPPGAGFAPTERVLALFAAAAAALCEDAPAEGARLGLGAAAGATVLWLLPAGLPAGAAAAPRGLFDPRNSLGLAPEASLALCALWRLAADAPARLRVGVPGDGGTGRLELWLEP